MSIKKQTCYIPVCDTCNREFDVGDYVAHFDNESEALNAAMDSEWLIATRETVFFGTEQFREDMDEDDWYRNIPEGVYCADCVDRNLIQHNKMTAFWGAFTRRGT